MGTIAVTFRAGLRRRWRSWFAIALLISVVGGIVLAATAAGRRTESAFPSSSQRTALTPTFTLPDLCRRLPGFQESCRSQSYAAPIMVNLRAVARTQ